MSIFLPTDLKLNSVPSLIKSEILRELCGIRYRESHTLESHRNLETLWNKESSKLLWDLNHFSLKATSNIYQTLSTLIASTLNCCKIATDWSNR